MKRVLLTGATGFIGRHCLLPLVARGYEVHAVSARPPHQNPPNLFWHQANLLETEQVTKLVARVQPSHLLHLAWFAVPGAYWTSLENLRWVQASMELLQAFASGGGKRVVMAGTCAEYHWGYGYCSEKLTPAEPSTLYGTCKHSLHLILDAFAKQTQLSAAWGRIFFLYGPHEHPNRLISSVVRSLLQGLPARCSHGNQIRDFLYVQDTAEAFVELLGADVDGAVNIGSGRPVAIKDVITQVAQLLNCQDLVQLGAIPAQANEPSLLVAETGRLNNEVGWSPKYELPKGLELTIQWWREQLGIK